MQMGEFFRGVGGVADGDVFVYEAETGFPIGGG